MLITRPMLAGKCTDLKNLRFPIYGTPKLDGVRALIINRMLVSRNFKLIPNDYIREILSSLPDNLDGELILKGKMESGAGFNKTSSAVMSKNGKPDITYYLFDYVKNNLDRPYLNRIEDLQRISNKNIKLLIPIMLLNQEELLYFEEECLKNGYEGIILRSPEGIYKNGRSTEKEGFLLKLKRFQDGEALIIDFIEKQSNQNIKECNIFGQIKRSTKKKGMVNIETLGTILVKDLKTGVEFGIGSGFDNKMRTMIWNNKSKYLKSIVKYKYQANGQLDKPRFPVFLGFRNIQDL